MSRNERRKCAGCGMVIDRAAIKLTDNEPVTGRFISLWYCEACKYAKRTEIQQMIVKRRKER